MDFWVYIEEGLYYQSSENKGADLRLCFCIGKNPIFSRSDSIAHREFYDYTVIIKKMKTEEHYCSNLNNITMAFMIKINKNNTITI